MLKKIALSFLAIISISAHAAKDEYGVDTSRWSVYSGGTVNGVKFKRYAPIKGRDRGLIKIDKDTGMVMIQTIEVSSNGQQQANTLIGTANGCALAPQSGFYFNVTGSIVGVFNRANPDRDVYYFKKDGGTVSDTEGALACAVFSAANGVEI